MLLNMQNLLKGQDCVFSYLYHSLGQWSREILFQLLLFHYQDERQPRHSQQLTCKLTGEGTTVCGPR